MNRVFNACFFGNRLTSTEDLRGRITSPIIICSVSKQLARDRDGDECQFCHREATIQEAVEVGNINLSWNPTSSHSSTSNRVAHSIITAAGRIRLLFVVPTLLHMCLCAVGASTSLKSPSLLLRAWEWAYCNLLLHLGNYLSSTS